MHQQPAKQVAPSSAGHTAHGLECLRGEQAAGREGSTEFWGSLLLQCNGPSTSWVSLSRLTAQGQPNLQDATHAEPVSKMCCPPYERGASCNNHGRTCTWLVSAFSNC